MVTIWHNPRCSKSRATLATLRENGIDPTIRLYLEDAPDAQEIREALAALQLPARSLIRSGDARFRDLGLSTGMDEEALIAAMAADPALIERPLVLVAEKAAIGRPPEAVLGLF